MYQIMIVDDEPASCRTLETLIRKLGKDFSVCGKFYHGRDALDAVRNAPPHVIITDIKMPVMDGLALTRAIRGLHLEDDPIIVIVSGFSDFSYAKTALQYGVVNYLLKPISAVEFTQTMEDIRKNLQLSIYRRKQDVIKLLCAGKKMPAQTLKRVFTDSHYHLALARYGSLPLRFPLFKGPEVFSEPENLIFSYGRDDRESLYICPAALFDAGDFHAKIISHVEGIVPDSLFYTILLNHTATPVNRFQDTIKKLYQELIGHVVIGKNGCFFSGSDAEPGVSEPLDQLSALSLFEKFCAEKNSAKARKELVRLLTLWHSQERPQLWLEQMLHHIFYLLEKAHLYFPDGDSEEHLLSEAFYNAENSRQFIANICDILFPDPDGYKEEKLDSQEYYQKIVGYIERNHRDALTLNSVCKALGLSPTYLNIILKKYGNETFKSCITRIRLLHAKRLLSEAGKQVKIKDIAEQAGFHDQFQFSKIFRAYTGMSPTDFMEKEEPPSQ